MLPYGCNTCWDRGTYVDYRNGRNGRTVNCTCGAGES